MKKRRKVKKVLSFAYSQYGVTRHLHDSFTIATMQTVFQCVFYFNLVFTSSLKKGCTPFTRWSKYEANL